MSTAFLFPGQGSQRVGMGRDLVTAFPYLMQKYYEPADRQLGFSLSDMCFGGPAERLRATDVTQPAIFLTSVAALDVLVAHQVTPDVVAGHSLGEYAAMVASGVLDWRDGLRLVRRRGELMASTNTRTPGRMAAVIGLDVSEVERLCATARRSSGQVVDVANDNDPTQVVVSGAEGAVRTLRDVAVAAGADRVTVLDVGGPFHSSLMQPVRQAFAPLLDQVALRPPSVPVLANLTADRVHTSDEVRQALQRQITERVRWTEILRRLASDSVDTVVEVGPGRVLTGFCSAAIPDARTFATSDLRRLRRALDALAPAAEGIAS